jgi:hypothetical protein
MVMDDMMWFGGLGMLVMLVVVILVVAGIVALARRPGGDAQSARTNGAQFFLMVLAAIGALALLGVVAMLLMHLGMGGMMRWS